MKFISHPNPESWKTLLKRPSIDHSNVEMIVRPILEKVKNNGDEAIREFTYQFDKIRLDGLQVDEYQISQAAQKIPPELKKAIQTAAENIKKFHQSQVEKENKIETMPGVVCWRKSVAIEKVGLYIPGGTAPLFSTVLMLGIPAMIAGCHEIILCTPPDKDGEIHPSILFAAHYVGINKIFKVGGAQAIAAMAYGTETIPKTYKIFGPGNQFVTVAKQLVNNEGTSIDMPAGPSELAVLADSSCNPAYIAADLISQCEHGKDSHVLLVSDNSEVIKKVNEEIKTQLDAIVRREMTQTSLQNSLSILVNSLEEGIDLINEYAPEHLVLQVENVRIVGNRIINAGSVFLGNYSLVAAGDYASGTNHTLPTNGYAKTFSGVSIDSFVKKITFQELSKLGFDNIAETIEVMSEAEGLLGHKESVTRRRSD